MNERTRLERLRAELELKMLTELLEQTNRKLRERGWPEERAAAMANGIAILAGKAA